MNLATDEIEVGSIKNTYQDSLVKPEVTQESELEKAKNMLKTRSTGKLYNASELKLAPKDQQNQLISVCSQLFSPQGKTDVLSTNMSSSKMVSDLKSGSKKKYLQKYLKASFMQESEHIRKQFMYPEKTSRNNMKGAKTCQLTGLSESQHF